MFEEIITSKEIKFNDLEKKVFKFVCFFGCLIIKIMLEAYDRKIMENRDKKKYRHKGLRETSVNTVMGEIKYKRAMYEIQEEGVKRTVYLLDETLKISVEGKVSSNLVQKVVETVSVTDSYRKAEKKNKEFNLKQKIKTELKLHVMYEGWKKDDPRHVW